MRGFFIDTYGHLWICYSAEERMNGAEPVSNRYSLSHPHIPGIMLAFFGLAVFVFDMRRKGQEEKT